MHDRERAIRQADGEGLLLTRYPHSGSPERRAGHAERRLWEEPDSEGSAPRGAQHLSDSLFTAERERRGKTGVGVGMVECREEGDEFATGMTGLVLLAHEFTGQLRPFLSKLRVPLRRGLGTMRAASADRAEFQPVRHQRNSEDHSMMGSAVARASSIRFVDVACVEGWRTRIHRAVCGSSGAESTPLGIDASSPALAQIPPAYSPWRRTVQLLRLMLGLCRASLRLELIRLHEMTNTSR